MTPNSEFRLLKNHLSSNRFLDVSIKDALNLIASRQKVINNRRSRTTDIKINHMLMISDIEHCKQILKEIE